MGEKVKYDSWQLVGDRIDLDILIVMLRIVLYIYDKYIHAKICDNVGEYVRIRIHMNNISRKCQTWSTSYYV